uniref:Uncharacterized protein n=1 Tax=viral metagenome TaxID=1070528 RepID=A0A6C0FDL6_9ZZZZ
MKITFYDEESYLVKTTSSFLIPSLYGALQGNYFNAGLNTLCFLVSVNFWYYPVRGVRRNIDLYFQPMFGTYMYILGNFIAKNPRTIPVGNICFLNGLYLYSRSCKEYRKRNRFWFVYHGLFHLSMSSACMAVQMSI